MGVRIVLKFLLGCWLLAQPGYSPSNYLEGRVISVHDGDTIRVDTSMGIISVRLNRIDAPELKQPGGRASQDNLKGVIGDGQLVRIENHGFDRYHRMLGEVINVHGLNLSELQVRSGHAWVYRAYCHDPQMLHLENLARNERLGMWSRVPVPPWEFRKKTTQQKSSRSSGR